MNQLITIDDIKIHQDNEGRYSLNDFHRVAGGNPKDQPANWMRSQQYHDLVDEISNSSNLMSLPVATKEGRNGGTYACKEIIYAYAMWVSAKFHLKVIRTFDAVVTGKLQQKSTFIDAAKMFRPAFMVAKMVGCPKNIAAISANQAVYARTKINLLEELGQTHLIAENQQEQYYTPTDLGKLHGLSNQRVNKLLEEAGLQIRIGDKWEPTETGLKHCIILDTGKKHNSGAAVTQVKWLPSVMKLLLKEAA